MQLAARVLVGVAGAKLVWMLIAVSAGAQAAAALLPGMRAGRSMAVRQDDRRAVRLL